MSNQPKNIFYYSSFLIMVCLIVATLFMFFSQRTIYKAESSISKLVQIRGLMTKYRLENERFPRNASEMGLRAEDDIDPLTCKPFSWADDLRWTNLENTGIRFGSRRPISTRLSISTISCISLALREKAAVRSFFLIGEFAICWRKFRSVCHDAPSFFQEQERKFKVPL